MVLRPFPMCILVIAVVAVGCSWIPVLANLRPDNDAFKLDTVDEFDAAKFRDRLADLPGEASGDPVARVAHLADSLKAAGWPGRMGETNYDARPVRLAIAQAVFDAVNRPEWQHTRYRGLIVQALTRDLSLLAGVEVQTWLEVAHRFIELPRKTDEWETASNILQAVVDDSNVGGLGAFQGHPGIRLFVESTSPRRNLFEDEHSALIHYLLGRDPIGVTGELYRIYPQKVGTHDPMLVLLELDYVLSRHLMESPFPPAAERLNRPRPAPPDRGVELVAMLARSGGRPGEALAFYYYQGGGRGSLFAYNSELRQALVASGSAYAQRRLQEFSAAVRRAVPDLEAEIDEIRAKPTYSKEQAEEMIETQTTKVREADAIEAALGTPR